MKCPFCNAELLQFEHTDNFFCHNEICPEWLNSMSGNVWRALIAGKRAKQGLFLAEECLNWIARPKATGESAAFARRTLKKIKEFTEPKEE